MSMHMSYMLQPLYVYGYNVKQMNNSIFSGPTQLQVILQQNTQNTAT